MAFFHRALRISSFLALAFILSQTLVPAYAATYSMTLNTDAPSYSGVQPIVITGTISPVPGANTAVIIILRNSAGTVADIAEVIPSSADGSFSYTSHPGGNQAWTSGTFTVNATWGGGGAAVSQVVTFTYSQAESSTTSSSTSSSTSTSKSTSTSTSTTSSETSSETSSTTSSTSTTPLASTNSTTSTLTTTTPAPEFPSISLPVVALLAVATVVVLARKFAPRPAGRLGPSALRAVQKN